MGTGVTSTSRRQQDCCPSDCPRSPPPPAQPRPPLDCCLSCSPPSPLWRPRLEASHLTFSPASPPLQHLPQVAPPLASPRTSLAPYQQHRCHHQAPPQQPAPSLQLQPSNLIS